MNTEYIEYTFIKMVEEKVFIFLKKFGEILDKRGCRMVSSQC